MMKAKGGPVGERHSYPFFLGPNNDSSIVPLASLALEERLADNVEKKYVDHWNMQDAANRGGDLVKSIRWKRLISRC